MKLAKDIRTEHTELITVNGQQIQQRSVRIRYSFGRVYTFKYYEDLEGNEIIYPGDEDVL